MEPRQSPGLGVWLILQSGPVPIAMLLDKRLPKQAGSRQPRGAALPQRLRGVPRCHAPAGAAPDTGPHTWVLPREGTAAQGYCRGGGRGRQLMPRSPSGSRFSYICHLFGIFFALKRNKIGFYNGSTDKCAVDCIMGRNGKFIKSLLVGDF